MKAPAAGTEVESHFAEKSQSVAPDKIDELLVALDKDIQHIQETLSRLDELRSLVIRRDDVSLSKLLEIIQAESDSYKSHELKRQSIREELAIALDCKSEQMTLSRLEAVLPSEKKAQIAERKTKLGALTAKLKKECLATAMLLSDCARFNTMLLRGIFELGRTGTITYNSKGSAKHQTNTAFVNLQF
jgi:hypothetical protein